VNRFAEHESSDQQRDTQSLFKRRRVNIQLALHRKLTMSSASICLFSVALCNVGSLNQFLFEQPQQQQQQGGGGGNLFGQAQNIFNGFVNNANNANLGNFGGNNNNKRPRSPYQSPCPKKFQYVTNGQGTEWKGVIRLNNIDLSRDLLIEADFALPSMRNVCRSFQVMKDEYVDIKFSFHV
jgi:hypothetical protein